MTELLFHDIKIWRLSATTLWSDLSHCFHLIAMQIVYLAVFPQLFIGKQCWKALHKHKKGNLTLVLAVCACCLICNNQIDMCQRKKRKEKSTLLGVIAAASVPTGSLRRVRTAETRALCKFVGMPLLQVDNEALLWLCTQASHWPGQVMANVLWVLCREVIKLDLWCVYGCCSWQHRVSCSR